MASGSPPAPDPDAIRLPARSALCWWPMALLRPSELARIWELHPKTVYLWIREGKLPALRTPGAQYRVRTDDARAYCEKNNLPPLPRAMTSPGGTVAAIGKPGAALRALAKLGVTSVVPRGKSEEAVQAVVDLLDGSWAKRA